MPAYIIDLSIDFS